jgi:V8-like Glu-specific endopeptidase
LRIADISTGSDVKQSISDWGFLAVVAQQPDLKQGTPLNIIQHPSGEPKQIAIRRNDYVGPGSLPSRFLYLTDTLPGSSGAPIFDDSWRVMGLHHASRKLPESVYMKGEQIKYNNEGILIHAILKDLPSHVRMEISKAQGWHLSPS